MELIQSANKSNAKFYDIAYSLVKGEDVTSQEIKLIESLIKDKDSRILDVGAGTGRHLFPLINSGYKVDAIEESIEMINEIKRKTNKFNDIKVFNWSFLEK
ncbi:MAG: methyltransferase domain-containing protein [Candidatus Dojkabacteria bacterium]|nr:methyltransferase domain-containing protein [Candidatus Dojkabacteria bacterium]